MKKNLEQYATVNYAIFDKRTKVVRQVGTCPRYDLKHQPIETGEAIAEIGDAVGRFPPNGLIYQNGKVVPREVH